MSNVRTGFFIGLGLLAALMLWGVFMHLFGKAAAYGH
jgi:hypothetical protein